MPKLKINGKLIAVFAVVAFAVCLISFGAQALATDEATDASTSNETLNEKVTITFSAPAYGEGNLVVQGGGLTYEVEKGSTITSPDSVDGIGRMYLSTENGQMLIASCYPSAKKLFQEWTEGSNLNEANEAGTWIINENTTFGSTLVDNTFSDNTGVITGYVGTGSDEEHTVPLTDYKVFFKCYSGGIYETLTDLNGHFRLSGIPFDNPGALNGFKTGFVSDFSDTITLGNSGTLKSGLDIGTVVVAKGIYANFVSSNPEKLFNVSKWYVSMTQHLVRQQADEFSVSAYEGHQFPDNALFRVLKTDETIETQNGEERTFKAGTLAYSYVFRYGVLGGIRYEIYFEPTGELPWNGWTYSNNVHSNVDVPSTTYDDEEKGVQINLNDGDYTFKMNYGEKLQAAQTGDDNLPIVIALIVLVCACGGFIVYRKLRKK